MRESKTMKIIENRNKGLNVNGIKLNKPKINNQDIERFAKIFIMNIPENKSVYTIMRKRNKFLIGLNELYELKPENITYFCERVNIEMGLKVDISWEEFYKVQREMGLI